MKQRGDTLVEVSIAIAVMGMAILSVFIVSDHNLAVILDTTERTSIRSSLNSQLDMFAYLKNHDRGKTGEWSKVKAVKQTNPDRLYINDAKECKPDPATAFYLTYDSHDSDHPVKVNRFSSKHALSVVPTPGSGIWLEYFANTERGAGKPYVDVVAKACWYPLGVRGSNDALGRMQTTMHIEGKLERK